MRIAIFSDIHAKALHLDPLFTDIDRYRVDEVWCLGDLTGYGAGVDADETARQVRKRCRLVLSGNHDWTCTERSTEFIDFLPPWLRDTLLDARGHLSPEMFAWLRDLPAEDRRWGINAFHGSYEDAITGAVDYPDQLKATVGSGRIAVVGHTHIPAAKTIQRRKLKSYYPRHDQVIDISKGMWVLNPGAAGLRQSEHRQHVVDRRPGWMLLDLANMTARWRRFDGAV